MATTQTKDKIEKLLTKLFGTPSNTPSWAPGTNEETCEFEFTGPPPAAKVTKVIAKVETDPTSSKETITYTKDGIDWKPRTWLGFIRTTLLRTLMAVLVFVAGYVLTVYVGVPAWNYVKKNLWTTAPATPAPATPAQNAPAPAAPAATPSPVVVPAPIVNVAGPVVSPQDAAALALLASEQQELLDSYATADQKMTEIRALINAKKGEHDRAEASVDNWQEQLDDATDDDVKEMAQAKLTAAKLEVSLRKKELRQLQQRETDALGVVKKLRSQNRKLLSRTPDTESDAALAALAEEMKNLTKAVKAGNTEVAAAVKAGSTDVATAVNTSGTKVATAVDNLTAEVKKQNDRIDIAFKNLLALDAMNKQTAEKLAETLNKIEAKKAVNAADPAILERIANAMEGTLEQLKKAPAPAPAAPAVSQAPVYQAPPAQGQYYAAPCQGNNTCYQVRRR